MKTCSRGPACRAAPVLRFLSHLTVLVLKREIESCKVFDLQLPMSNVAEDDRSLDERRDVKTSSRL